VRDGSDSPRGERIAAAGVFGGVELRSYAWSKAYHREEWIDFLGTHSDHVLLAEDQRRVLLNAVATTVDQLGGVVRTTYQTVLILARRGGC